MLHAGGKAFHAVSVYIQPGEEALLSPFQQCGKEATISLICRHVETVRKLNPQTARAVSCVQVRDDDTQSKHYLQHASCSGSNRLQRVSASAKRWHFDRHSNIHRRQLALWPLQNLSVIFFEDPWEFCRLIS